MAERWTGEQRTAILERRHALLEANAGTGKTATVVAKIRWRVGQAVEDSEEGPIPPCPAPCDLDGIGAITFTEKAAQDVRRKLRETLVGRDGAGAAEIDRAFVGTIHGFCGDVLREHALRLDIDPAFRVMDARESSLRLSETVRDVVLEALEAGERDVMDLVRDKPLDRLGSFGGSTTDLVRGAMRDLRWHRERYEAWMPRTGAGGAEPTLDVGALRALAAGGGATTGLGEADEKALARTATSFRLAHRALARWLDLLERENRRDFDSLVLDVRRLLTRPEHRPALHALRRRFRLLVVDEFQDTDTAQRDIVFAIAGLETDAGSSSVDPFDPPARPVDPAPSTQLLLVGDPKQSIYGFRDADVRVWNEARAVMEARGVALRLTRNFRCDPAIVDLVNRACEPAFDEAGAALGAVDPAAVVGYDRLRAGVKRWSGAGVEWLVTEREGGATEAGRKGAALVASRIAFLLKPDAGARVRDEDGTERPARPSDVAVLAVRRKTLGEVERFLRELEIPVYNASSGGLAERQEVIDAITALRLADNPRDDLRAFAFLRSPFVGLRDETIARIGLDPAVRAGSLLLAARRWLDAVASGEVGPFAAPESPWIEPTERGALRRGLEALEEAHGLVGRAEPAEILETILDRTAYRLHLRLRRGTDEALANLERLKAILGEFRALTLADFLRAWELSADDPDADLGTAQLPDASEGAVLLTTIHKAKGLEWPIVVLAGATAGAPKPSMGAWDAWTDRELGPVVMPKKDERGPRSERAEGKRLLEDAAEQARLLYVAITRPRHRLLVAAPSDEPIGHAGWIARGLLAGPPPEGGERRPADGGAARDRPGSGNAPARGSRAEAEDPATGTGRQLDAFGLHDPPADEGGQLNLLNPENHAPDLRGRRVEAGGDIPLTVWRAVEPVQVVFEPAPVALEWLEGIEEIAPSPALSPIEADPLPVLRSATELAMERRDRRGWLLRYVHGVVPGWRFAGAAGEAPSDVSPEEGVPGAGLPGDVRGTIVHRVLETAGLEEEDLSALLEEAIGGLDEEGARLPGDGAGRGERRGLEEEVRRVLESDAWREWMSGEHHRELPFVHFAAPREWRQGRIDLFLPPRPAPRRRAAPVRGEARVVDFKTNRVEAGEVESAARRYEVQAQVYRDAVRAILAGSAATSDAPDVRVVLHFTGPGRQVEL
ncbi:MAG: UvrD-helicase domain-containing protein [Gemmatimonadota bacterium]